MTEKELTTKDTMSTKMSKPSLVGCVHGAIHRDDDAPFALNAVRALRLPEKKR